MGSFLLIIGAGIGWGLARRGEAAATDAPAGVAQTEVVGPRSLAAAVLATGVIRPGYGSPWRDHWGKNRSKR